MATWRWPDTAYRSKKNEAFLERGMFKSNIHQKRMPRRPMPEHIARANAPSGRVKNDRFAQVFLALDTLIR